VRFELAGTERPREEAARISQRLGLDHEETGQARRLEAHAH
jgi:hypothetical protein